MAEDKREDGGKDEEASGTEQIETDSLSGDKQDNREDDKRISENEETTEVGASEAKDDGDVDKKTGSDEHSEDEHRLSVIKAEATNEAKVFVEYINRSLLLFSLFFTLLLLSF